ncbi:exported hypothetical protein [Candidatus Sulfotelmatobacter kueseliae]|uniref:Secreted protein n=1 Tax=Candidatus Sulfotelmatobacter kueseliae TaxID=2042962 RepID=A0A2U3KMX2_9BACT|nr:exported hypothetical protein [Candidatus Sulfotelmatobacter kueseliae]
MVECCWVAGFFAAVSALASCRALATGTKTQLASSALSALNRALRILLKSLIIRRRSSAS